MRLARFKDREILVMQKDNSKCLVYVKTDKLRIFEMDKKVFSDAINEASKDRVPAVYKHILGAVWVLEKDQIRKFIKLVKAYEV